MKNQTSDRFFTLLILLIPLCLVNFIACSDDSNPTEPQKATVTGTLNLPQEAAGKAWGVLFDTDLDGDNGYVFLGMGLCGNGTEVAYSVSDVPTGTYYLYAAVFVVSDGSEGPQYGDFIGIYGGDYPNNLPASANAEVTSGTNTFDINLVEMID